MLVGDWSRFELRGVNGYTGGEGWRCTGLTDRSLLHDQCRHCSRGIERETTKTQRLKQSDQGQNAPIVRRDRLVQSEHRQHDCKVG